MPWRPQANDTSASAERVLFEIYSRMTPAEKVDRIRSLSRAANRLALAGLRERHPDESEAELHRRLVAMRLGEELANRAYAKTDG